MDRTYAEVPKEALGASINPSELSEAGEEISTLGQALYKRTLISMLPSDNDHQSIMMPILALHNTDYQTEELTFLPSDAPRHLMPSFSTLTADCQGEPFLRDIP